MQYVLRLDNNISIDNFIIDISKGDMRALEKLYNNTRTIVLGYAFSILKNITEAEDVMQDVYLNIYKSAYLYSSKNKALAWIITITRNLCLEKIRKRKKIIFDDIGSVEHLLIDKDISYDKVLLKALLEELNSEERQIVILNSMCGFTFLEIGKMMNLKLSTVLSKYNRAIKRLRIMYKEVNNEE